MEAGADQAADRRAELVEVAQALKAPRLERGAAFLVAIESIRQEDGRLASPMNFSTSPPNAGAAS
jgi:hypothetical protein